MLLCSSDAAGDHRRLRQPAGRLRTARFETHVDGDIRDDANDASVDTVDPDVVVDRCTPFSQPRNVTELNTPDDDWAPSLSPDELTIYFASGVAGERDIWRATRADRSAAFGAPQRVIELNSTVDDDDPAVAASGVEIMFTRGLPEGYVLFRSTRASAAVPWSAPARVMGLDSPDQETGPSMSSDSLTLYYAFDREPPLPDRIAIAARATTTENFTFIRELDEVNVLGAVNFPEISADGRELYFSQGETLENAIWVARRSASTGPLKVSQRSRRSTVRTSVVRSTSRCLPTA